MEIAAVNVDKKRIDWYLLISVIGLMLFSIAFVYSASSATAEVRFGDSEKLFFSHSLRILVGIIIMFVFAKINYQIWLKFSKTLLLISAVLLVFVLAVGTNIKGAARWIDLGPISFQPSELAKIALAIHFSSMLSRKQENIKDFETGFLPFLLWALLICGLIALQPNFSTMIIIFFISISMMFIGNCNLLYLITTGLIGIFAAGIYMVSASYRLNRLLAFLGLSSETSNNEAVNYQLNQALIAIGNGGFTGLGVGNSRQSHLFLPESYGDFIYSIIGEEWGFIGSFAILAVFMFIFYRGLLIAKKAPDNFGYFLAIGIMLTFAFNVFINAGVNTGVLPTTGVPMPFVSYGGTAVIFYSAAIGILLNISAQAGVYKVKDEVPVTQKLAFPPEVEQVKEEDNADNNS